jgi:hypothetical protein
MFGLAETRPTNEQWSVIVNCPSLLSEAGAVG